MRISSPTERINSNIYYKIFRLDKQWNSYMQRMTCKETSSDNINLLLPCTELWYLIFQFLFSKLWVNMLNCFCYLIVVLIYEFFTNLLTLKISLMFFQLPKQNASPYCACITSLCPTARQKWIVQSFVIFCITPSTWQMIYSSIEVRLNDDNLKRILMNFLSFLVFRAFDRDMDSHISAEEWVKGLSVFLRGNLEQLTECESFEISFFKHNHCLTWFVDFLPTVSFQVYDLNSAGVITREAMYQLLKSTLIKVSKVYGCWDTV